MSSSAAEDGASDARAPGYSPAEGMRIPAFYMLFLASLFSAMTGVAVMLNLVPVLTFTGLDRADAIWILSFMGIASFTGRLIGGWLMDRYDVRMLAIAASVVSLIMPIGLLFFPGVFAASMIAVLSWGLTGGMKLNAIVYLTRVYMGARSFGFFYGAISITTTMAQGVSPFVANYLYDMTQSYWAVIWATIPGFLIAALMFLLLGPRPDFDRRS